MLVVYEASHLLPWVLRITFHRRTVDFTAVGVVVGTWEGTVLSDRCHEQPGCVHRVFDIAGALVAVSAHILIRKNLVNSFNSGRKIEVLRYLFDSMANHSGLDNIFRPHCRTTWYSRRPSGTWAKWHVYNEVCRDLRARREYLPDFEWAFHVDYLDSF